MPEEIAALIRFLHALGDTLGAVLAVGSLPVLAFIFWLALPKRGP
jgi:hypothetical protein